MTKIVLFVLLLIFLWVRPMEGTATQSNSSCEDDTRATIRLMRDAYPGAAAKLASNLAATIAEAEQRLLKATAKPISDLQCDTAILEYLFAWRDGHVSLETASGAAGWHSAQNARSDTAPAPRWIALGRGIVVLRLPSFLGTDTLIAEFAHRLRRVRPLDTLVIDVRGNRGGSDSAYMELEAELRQRSYRTPGIEARVTPETIAALELILETLGERVSEQSRAMMAARIGKMRSHKDEWLSFAQHIDRSVLSSPRPMVARHLVVLVDGQCASSCENFLLDLRAGTDAVLIGHNSAGIGDYGNVAAFMLPSKARLLLLPTTRSLHLPGTPIDGVGVAPDVPLDWEECSDTCYWVLALRALRDHLAKNGMRKQ
jgi:hypothetical protein